jgi:hypothetical protein
VRSKSWRTRSVCFFRCIVWVICARRSGTPPPPVQPVYIAKPASVYLVFHTSSSNFQQFLSINYLCLNEILVKSV